MFSEHIEIIDVTDNYVSVEKITFCQSLSVFNILPKYLLSFKCIFPGTIFSIQLPRSFHAYNYILINMNKDVVFNLGTFEQKSYLPATRV